MYNNVKFNFIQQLLYAVRKPYQYYRLTKVSKGRMIGFVFLFVFITSLFTIIPMFIAELGPQGISHFLKEELPEFELRQGELHSEETFEYKENGVYVLFDTNRERFTTDDIDRTYYQVMLISRTNMIIYQTYGNLQEIDFSNWSMLHLDNSIIEAFIPLMLVFLILFAVFLYIFEVGLYFLTALLYALVSLVVSLLSNARLTFGTNYKVAIYGKVPAYILTSVILTLLSRIGLSLPNYIQTGGAILITCAFVVFGTISHTSEEAYEEAGYHRNQQNWYN